MSTWNKLERVSVSFTNLFTPMIMSPLLVLFLLFQLYNLQWSVSMIHHVYNNEEEEAEVSIVSLREAKSFITRLRQLFERK